MAPASKRKTSLSLDAETLDAARDLRLNVSALAEAALRRAVARGLDRDHDPPPRVVPPALQRHLVELLAQPDLHASCLTRPS